MNVGYSLWRSSRQKLVLVQIKISINTLQRYVFEISLRSIVIGPKFVS